jgi:hypothetical protein
MRRERLHATRRILLLIPRCRDRDPGGPLIPDRDVVLRSSSRRRSLRFTRFDTPFCLVTFSICFYKTRGIGYRGDPPPLYRTHKTGFTFTFAERSITILDIASNPMYRIRYEFILDSLLICRWVEGSTSAQHCSGIPGDHEISGPGYNAPRLGPKCNLSVTKPQFTHELRWCAAFCLYRSPCEADASVATRSSASSARCRNYPITGRGPVSSATTSASLNPTHFREIQRP